VILMGKFNYKDSHRADRTELLKSPPTYSETFQHIEDTKMTKEERAMFGLSVLTGARISEVLGVQQKDIKIYGGGNIIISSKDTNNYQLCAPYEIQKIIITMMNKKSKKQKFKQVPIVNNAIFTKPISWLIDRLAEQGINPNMKLFTFTRQQAWWRIKRRLGNDWFCHMTRHVAASNDVRAGINPGVLKEKLGWSDLSPYGAYVHLNVDAIHDELKRIYGPNMEKYNEAVGTTTDDRALKKPLSPTQLLGAYAAAAGVKEVKTHIPMGNIKKAFKKETVVVQDGKKQNIYLSREAREIRDKIRASGVLKPKLPQPNHIVEVDKKVEIEIVTPAHIPTPQTRPIPTVKSQPIPVRQILKPIKTPEQDVLQIV